MVEVFSVQLAVCVRTHTHTHTYTHIHTHTHVRIVMILSVVSEVPVLINVPPAVPPPLFPRHVARAGARER